MNELIFDSRNLLDTERAGADIASRLAFPSCVYLTGEMGAGKTTLTKSIIQAFGYQGEVTSPTYNLIQEYQVVQGIVYHMDLYRLDDPSEIEFLAIDDLWSEQSLFLIEWPSRAGKYLKEPSHEIVISKKFEESEDARKIILKTFS
jgi:tRNA threonylcarbamoyladenosine biosynthesis protein TsaE